MKTIKFELDQKSKAIAFNEEKHRYHDGDQEYVSVTTLIAKYTPEFDPDGHITRRCADKRGISDDQMRAEWDLIADDACKKGTHIHLMCEMLSLGIPIPASPENTALKLIIQPFLDTVSVLSTEQIIYDKKVGISGMIDLIGYKDDKLVLYDYKTNKGDLMKPGYGQLLKPLEHLENSTYNKYSLQLSIYRLMLENWGYKVEDSYLVHINGGIKVIKVPYLIDEARMMLNEMD